MSAREEILNRLRAAQRPSAVPPAWESQRQFADPVIRFAETLSVNKGEFYQAGNLDQAIKQLTDLIGSMSAQRIVCNNEPPFDRILPQERWPDLDWQVAGARSANWQELCAQADLGVSGADAALAETGTIVISSGTQRSRLTTLLPPIHVALVGSSQLTNDIFTWTASRQGALPANVVLVGGPSKTADIEQTLSVGVHGPKRFIVILYDD